MLQTIETQEKLRAHAAALRYRPDIDGMRAVAVLAVVLYHADIAPLNGGFVGVDVFFVISGFLITSIIEKDIAAGRFSFARFYERRIRRIFPALAAMSLFSVVVGAILFVPIDFERLGESLIAMALFSSNLFFRDGAGVSGYFHAGPSPQMLIHTWSLAVEEQFYLFLPPALLIVHRYARRFLLFILVAAIALSLTDSVTLVSRTPSDAFYLIGPRAWELLIGSLLALRPLPAPSHRVARELMAAAGVALILYAIFTYSNATPFPGAAALAPCIGAWLCLYAGDNGSNLTARLLSTKPFVFVGRISYSLYLWHWPIFVTTKYMSGGYMSFAPALFAIALSFLVAYLSYRFVETPLRSGLRGTARRTIFVSTALMSLTLMAIGGGVVLNRGLPWRYDQRTQELVARNLARELDFSGDSACDNFRHEIHSAADVRWCPIGAAEKHNILVWGDSHAGELRPVMDVLFREGALKGRGALFAVAPACVPSISMERVGDDLSCNKLARYALERAIAPDIDVVLIFASAYRVVRDDQLCRLDGAACRVLPKDKALDLLAREYLEYARLLESLGKQVIIGLPDPFYNREIPRYEILRATLPTLGLLQPLVRDDAKSARDALSSAARSGGAGIFDARESLCVADRCHFEDDGISFYLDNDHVARSNLGVFHDGLRKTLEKAFAATTPSDVR